MRMMLVCKSTQEWFKIEVTEIGREKLHGPIVDPGNYFEPSYDEEHLCWNDDWETYWWGIEEDES